MNENIDLVCKKNECDENHLTEIYQQKGTWLKYVDTYY